MPTYDFICPKCGTKQTLLMHFSDLAKNKKNPPRCPKCGNKTEYKFPNPAGRVI